MQFSPDRTVTSPSSVSVKVPSQEAPDKSLWRGALSTARMVQAGPYGRRTKRGSVVIVAQQPLASGSMVWLSRPLFASGPLQQLPAGGRDNAVHAQVFHDLPVVIIGVFDAKDSAALYKVVNSRQNIPNLRGMRPLPLAGSKPRDKRPL